MSFQNNVCAHQGKIYPAPYDEEYFIIQRGSINFEVELPGKEKYKGKGRVYFSTRRILFCKDKVTVQHGIDFNSFEMPLSDIMDDKFCQPIFGTSLLKGTVCQQDSSDGICEPIKWKMIFNHGGTGVVLPAFLNLMKASRAICGGSGPEDIDIGFIKQQQAYVDPSDPTTIYVTQPTDFTAF